MEINYANKTTDKEFFFQKGHISPIKLLESFPVGAKIQNNKRVKHDKWKSFISWQNFNK